MIPRRDPVKSTSGGVIILSAETAPGDLSGFLAGTPAEGFGPPAVASGCLCISEDTGRCIGVPSRLRGNPLSRWCPTVYVKFAPACTTPSHRRGARLRRCGASACAGGTAWRRRPKPGSRPAPPRPPSPHAGSACDPPAGRWCSRWPCVHRIESDLVLKRIRGKAEHQPVVGIVHVAVVVDPLRQDRRVVAKHPPSPSIRPSTSTPCVFQKCSRSMNTQFSASLSPSRR